ncbi:MAG: TonB-dependent receptor plug domain-containing protein, partial [Saprospiraceae bacterium]|nr:TonB-dependent receptor plug domain-containing protein [Saprospiraceae bacterium]
MKRLYFVLLLAFASQAIYAQSLCTGTVSDSDGNPMIGVSVYEKGTTRGTVTDVNGSYSLECSADAILVFSYVGYATQEIELEGKTELNVVLLEGITLADLEIVGSRSLNRSVTGSPVAIDVIDIREVTNSVGQLDLNQLLQFAAPSFNANRQSGADGADHVDPATLRGLGPDQTLVLVNGKRRHQSSLINLYGTRGRGNTGTDLNSIPAAAIERIEILRDGASAQYGSDAIAGVVNIVLKSSADEFSGNVNLGVHKATDNGDKNFDGENLQLNGNYGFKVGDGGFVNVTLDYWDKGRTNRRDPGLYRQQFGDAQATNFGAYFNSRIPISKNAHFYAFGGTNFRKTDAFAWTRDPGSSRNVLSIYPNGFDPHIVSDITDKSASAGIRGDLNGWDVDFNHTFGANRFHYYG